MTRLGLVLATDSAGDLAWTAALARAARERRLEVELFLMSRGVVHAAGAVVQGLVDDGCDVVACATSHEAHRAAPPVLGVALGSQDDHARLAASCDRVVAFT